MAASPAFGWAALVASGVGSNSRVGGGDELSVIVGTNVDVASVSGGRVSIVGEAEAVAEGDGESVGEGSEGVEREAPVGAEETGSGVQAAKTVIARQNRESQGDGGEQAGEDISLCSLVCGCPIAHSP
ncbi:MAG: hypothetical protein ABIN58_03915 [candidate division WOR-3 bacterium]